jgi:LEA14-like dessication related protein
MKILLAIIIIITFSISPQIFAQEIEVIGEMSFDWGEVKTIESPLHTRIKITNKGDKALRIFSIKAGCGCTTAPLDKDVLLPGDTSNIDVRLDLRNFMGPIEKTLTIMTNDPEARNIVFKLHANIIQALSKLPNYFPYGQIILGETAEAKVIVKNNSKEDIKVMKIAKTPPDMEINLKEGKIIRPGTEIEVITRLKPMKVGKFESSITIMTNNIDMPRLSISGWGKAVEK